jgi:hypothetical protein
MIKAILWSARKHLAVIIVSTASTNAMYVSLIFHPNLVILIKHRTIVPIMELRGAVSGCPTSILNARTRRRIGQYTVYVYIRLNGYLEENLQCLVAPTYSRNNHVILIVMSHEWMVMESRSEIYCFSDRMSYLVCGEGS